MPDLPRLLTKAAKAAKWLGALGSSHLFYCPSVAISVGIGPGRYWLHTVTGTLWQKLSTLQIDSRCVWQTVCGECCTLTTGGAGRICVGPIGVI
jgi:hypothetical protein